VASSSDLYSKGLGFMLNKRACWSCVSELAGVAGVAGVAVAFVSHD
jgi:hypothetical protein